MKIRTIYPFTVSSQKFAQWIIDILLLHGGRLNLFEKLIVLLFGP